MLAVAVSKPIGVASQMFYSQKMWLKTFMNQYTYATQWQYKHCHGKLA
jgi:hypothetical protein